VGASDLTAVYRAVSQVMIVNCLPSSLHTAGFFREASDEFVGPFPSWTNVKTSYGAVGDGKADDTAALQAAIDDLDKDGKSPVLWLPAGIYRVTSTLTITHKCFFSLLGEDPATTSIIWAGAPHGTILRTDASTWFRIARLTFDGAGIADTAEDLDDTYTPGGNYSTFNDLSDQHILGVTYGIRLPVDAETTIERVFFDHIATYGVSLESFNTLNIFISDSIFLECSVGVSNEAGAGDFIVSNSFFTHSQVADMSIGNTGYFTARHNTSVSSRAFFYSAPMGANTAMITLQNNTILDPETTPFYLGNLGPLMLIDNTVRMQQSDVPNILVYNDPTALKDVFSFGNTYTPNAGPQTDGGLSFSGRIDSYDDLTVPVAEIPDVVVPSNVYVPPNLHRKVYEVAAFNGTAIQNAIDLAVAGDSEKPVVHLQAGQYSTTQTISVPTGSSIQLVGDDAHGSQIEWVGTSSGPAVAINSSNTTVRNLMVSISSPGSADGIQVSVADQPSSQVIVDEAELQSGNAYSVNFDGIEHLNAGLYDTYTAGSITGVNTMGGPFRKAKMGTIGMTNFYSGSLQSEGNATSFGVSSYGKFMVQDNWHDNGETSPYNFELSGGGTVTEQTGEVAMNGPTPFVINNFDGNVTLMGLQFSGGFDVSGAQSQTNVLTLGLVGSSSTYLPQSSGNVTVNNLLDSYYNLGGGHIASQDSPSDQWLRTMLAETRTEYPIHRLPTTSGTSRIRLSRVAIQNAESAIHIIPATTQTGLYYTISNNGSQLSVVGARCIAPTLANSGGGDLQWTLIPAGDGDYELSLRGATQFLGVQTTSLGTDLAYEAQANGYEQRWLVLNIGDGTFQFVNRATGQLLSGGTGCAGLDDAPSAGTSWTVTAH
jgi:hypothetical protein